MTNPPDPKTKTPRSEAAKIDAGWIVASHSAGDFVRADVAETLELENQSLTRRLEEAEKPAINTNVRLFDLVRYQRSELLHAGLITEEEYGWLCGGPMAISPKGGSPSRQRLEDYDELRAKLTALRTVAEGLAKHGSTFIRLSFFQGINQAEYQHDRENHELAKRISETSCNLQDAEDAFNAALAALRAELDQADSNASNSPTDSLESQG